MKIFRLLCLYLGVTTTLMASPMEYRDSELRTLQRRKRYLAFPKGTSLQIVYCFLVSAFGTNNFFTVGITLGAAWEIPEDVASLIDGTAAKPALIRRRHARSLYPTVEEFLHRLGVNGQACILRAICEATYSARRNGTFIEEVMHAIFTFPDVEEDFENGDSFIESSIYDFPRKNSTSCQQHYSDCPISILDFDFFT